MTDHSGNDGSGVDFERSDVDAGALLRFGSALVVATLAVMLLLWRLYFVFVAQEAARQPPAPVMKADPVAMAPPAPNLQDGPARDLARFRAEEDSVLRSYGWVDEEKGIVRIPIEEAMRLLAEKGLPSPAPPGGERGGR